MLKRSVIACYSQVIYRGSLCGCLSSESSKLIIGFANRDDCHECSSRDSLTNSGNRNLGSKATFRENSDLCKESSLFSQQRYFQNPKALCQVVENDRWQGMISRSFHSCNLNSSPRLTLVSGDSKQQELKAVNTAVLANTVILSAKLAGWGLSGSGALLAEAIHSVCDIANQLLLKAGVQQSRRAPTRQHPYGFHREKYIYALMSAVCVFCIGSGATFVYGIQSIMDPPDLEHMEYSLGILCLSGAIEMGSLLVAYRVLQQGASSTGLSLWSYLKRGRDPTTSAVLAEDAGAVVGLGIAGVASYFSLVTGDPLYDAFGSIGVGVLMGAIAITLIRNYKRFLIGQAIEPGMQQALVAHLKSDPMVLCVHNPMSEEIGDGLYRFKADIQWSGETIVQKYLESLAKDELYSEIKSAACFLPSEENDVLKEALDAAMTEFGRGVISTVGEEIDRLEVELQSICPGLIYVDLETERGK